MRERFIRDGIAEYLKRLKPYARLEIREAPEEKIPEHVTPGEEKKILGREAEGILRLLPGQAYVIALDRAGEMLSSEELAEKLAALALGGKNEVALVIGGTLGLAPAILQRADLRLSFSRLTFPHQLMRLILLEQLYRAYKIMRGEQYHR
ncbi:MAG: rRNA (pseudouridine1915-N3)-methyltransferase [Clostridia bacterium]|nr:rRNA (pseudouridine1915-N3)-methyltransferase [Clostridia bacterium]